MSFGFSVGDFIAALEVVGAVIASLRETGGAKSQFRELTQELYSLELALIRVKQLEFEEDQVNDYAALKQAACQCQFTIDAFWKVASRYQRPLLSNKGSLSLVDAWKKVQWALLRTEDLTRFKSDIVAHTQSILLLLSAVQLKTIQLQSIKTRNTLHTITGALQQVVEQCYNKFSLIVPSLLDGVAQGQAILDNSVKIFQSNIRIFQAVRAIQKILSQMPHQVDRQQPVYMIDALGKVAPFHLEFVRSSEALKAVLKSNFEKIPSGLRKIENGEFIIHDAGNGRRIDLDADWDICFLPGQKVDMRMTFYWNTNRRKFCPACDTHCIGRMGVDTQCPQCGLIFRRTLDATESSSVSPGALTKPNVRHLEAMLQQSKVKAGTSSSLAPKTAYDESDDMRFYRRIRLLQRSKRKLSSLNDTVASPKILQPNLPVLPSAADLEATGVEHQDEAEIPDDATFEQTDGVNLDDPDNAIDQDTFRELLEMDDDAERDFSKAMMMDGLINARHILERLKSYTDECNWSQCRSEMHYMEGVCRSHGFTVLAEINLEMHDAAGAPEAFEDNDAVKAFILPRLSLASEEWLRCKEQLYIFYKIDATTTLEELEDTY